MVAPYSTGSQLLGANLANADTANKKGGFAPQSLDAEFSQVFFWIKVVFFAIPLD